MTTGRPHRTPPTATLSLATVALLLAALLAVPLLSAANSPQAHAAVSNAAIADKALSYRGKARGQACRDAGNDAADGQCRSFVNCVIKLVTGKNTAVGWPDYFTGFERNGQRITDVNQLAKGDVVQKRRNEGPGLHTFIILNRLSGNSFSVVDSNGDGKSATVAGGPDNKRTVDLKDDTRAYRFGAVSGGATPPPASGGSGNPFGHVDSVTRAPGGLRAQGWVIDPNTNSPIEAHAYSGNGNPGGGPGAATRADRDRPDVARAYPGRGAAHGFDVTVPAAGAGKQTACVYGINVGAGNTNPRIGCSTLTVSPDPYGHLDGVRRVPGGIEASGWSIDPDSGAPIEVHVYGGSGNPGGGPGVATRADQNRPDVGDVYPNYGSRHGFTVFLATGPQAQTVCAYGINNGPGTNPQIGCKRI